MSPESGVERINHAEEVMGTVVTFDLFVASDTDRSEIHLTLSRARASLHRADAIFSTWKPNSPMSLLRRGETTLADAPVEIADVLSRCEDARDLTNGLFDPRTGSFHAMAASASVAGKDLGLADALATALCVEGEEGLALLEELPDYEAYLVTRSGEHRYTSNFPFADDTRPDTPR